MDVKLVFPKPIRKFPRFERTRSCFTMDVEMKEAPAEDPVVVGAQETYDRALAVADAQPQEAITALNEILATGMLKCVRSALAC